MLATATPMITSMRRLSPDPGAGGREPARLCGA
jgi:hypothetical protein